MHCRYLEMISSANCLLLFLFYCEMKYSIFNYKINELQNKTLSSPRLIDLRIIIVS